MSDNRQLARFRENEDVAVERQNDNAEDSDEDYARQLRQQKMKEQKHVH